MQALQVSLYLVIFIYEVEFKINVLNLGCENHVTSYMFM